MDACSNDQRCLRAWSNTHDEDAFAELVERYAGLVAGICRRVTDRADLADEATQAVFLLVAERAERLADHPSIGGWLVVAARRVASRALRAERHRRHHELHAGTLAMTTADTHVELDSALLDRIDAGLARLSSPERDVIVHRYLLGLEWDEVSEQLQVRRNTAEKRASRGLSKLRRWCGAVPGLTASGLILALGALPAQQVAAASLTSAVVAGGAPSAATLAGEMAGVSVGSSVLPGAVFTALVTLAVAVAVPLGLITVEISTSTPSEPCSVATRQGHSPLSDPAVGPVAASAAPWILDLRHDEGGARQLQVLSSADGHRLVTANSFHDEICLWEAREGESPELVASADLPGIGAIAMAPSGDRIAVMGSTPLKGLQILSWPDLSVVSTHAIPGGHVLTSQIAFTADEESVVVATRGQLDCLHLSDDRVDPIAVYPPDEHTKLLELRAAIQTAEQAGGQAPAGEVDRLQAEYQQRVGAQLERVTMAVVGDQVVSLIGRETGPQAPVVSPLANLEQSRVLAAPPLSIRTNARAQRLMISADGTLAAVSSQRFRSRSHLITVWEIASGAVLAQREVDSSYDHLFAEDHEWLVGVGQDARTSQVQALHWPTGQTRILASGDANVALHAIMQAGARSLVAVPKQGRMANIFGPDMTVNAQWQLYAERPLAAAVAVATDGRIAQADLAGHVALWDLATAQRSAVAPFMASSAAGSTGMASFIPSAGGMSWIHLAFDPYHGGLLLLHGAQGQAGLDWTIAHWNRDAEEIAIDATAHLPTALVMGSTLPLIAGAGINQDEAVIMGPGFAVRYDVQGHQQRPTMTWDAGSRYLEFLNGLRMGPQSVPLHQGRMHLDLGSQVIDGADRPTGFTIQDPYQRWRARFQREEQRTRLSRNGSATSVSIEGVIPVDVDATGEALLVAGFDRLAVVSVSPDQAISVTDVPAKWMVGTRPMSVSVGLIPWQSTWDMRLLPGGRYLATGSKHGIQLIDVASGERVARLLSWSDGDWIVALQDGRWHGSVGARARLLGADAAAIDGLRDPAGVAAFLASLADTSERPGWVTPTEQRERVDRPLVLTVPEVENHRPSDPVPLDEPRGVDGF